MLARSGASNTSGKSVTTLIASIGLFHGNEVIPPRLHHRARLHPDEREQPLTVVCAPPRHDQRSRHDLTLLVHDQQPGLRREHRTRILHEGKHCDLPPPPHAPQSNASCHSVPTSFSKASASAGTAPTAG